MMVLVGNGNRNDIWMLCPPFFLCLTVEGWGQ